MDSSLTPKQKQWHAHIVAAKDARLSFVEYAEQHQLDVKKLYAWHGALRKKGVLETARESAFIAVKPRQGQPSARAAGLSARLPNGVVVEVTATTTDLLTFVGALAAL